MSAVLAAVLPVFLVAGTSYLIRRRIALDVRTLSSLNIYLFIPALIFRHLSRSTIAWSLMGRCAAAAVVMAAAMALVLGVAARFRPMDASKRSAFMMTMFPNLGNFGLPVVRFAFGEGALAFSVVVLVCGSLLQNTLGVYFAQRSRHGVGEAFLRVFRFPMVYSFFLALLFQANHWDLPQTLFRAVDITAEAAIPVQLVMLGAKLAETRLDTGADVFLACALRLCLGPALALGAALVAGLDGAAAKTFILQMSSPVAVGMAVYGVQFNVQPRFLASVVSWSFLLSAVTVSLVLAALRALSL